MSGTDEAQVTGIRTRQDAVIRLPLVSIIVPAYNAADHLQRCVASLWAQTYSRCEFIIVDDGSTDGTPELSDRLAEADRRTTVVHVSNGGVSEARNTGIAHARGELIQFADADDLLDPGMTARLVSTLIASQVDLVICGVRQEDPAGNVISEHQVSVERRLSQKELLEYSSELRDLGLLNSPCNKLFRKDLIDAGQVRFPVGVSLGEDAVFNLNYLGHCDHIFLTPEVLYRYVRYPGEDTLSTGWRPRIYADWRGELEAKRSLFKRHDLPLAQAEQDYALELATQVIPHLALNAHRGYHSYLQSAREARRDPYFVRYASHLEAREWRGRLLLWLFRASRHELIAAVMGAWRIAGLVRGSRSASRSFGRQMQMQREP